ncbi:N-acetylgalactosamine-6-sulfatase, partial [Verrucomicrobia bacterium]|nr:N-acetylgalactosamine-6-sulfatase [Verrucomicrobiota bacterium]
KKHPHLYWEFHEQGGKRAVRKGFWKAVQRNIRRSQNSPTELYDLSQDLGEKVDVSAQYPEMVAEMKRLMDASHNDRMDVGL